jgi:broad specificity phosphatase PhoE
MESLELVLVRHGESEGNRDRRFGGHGPSRLTELGRRQAAAAAQAISRLPVDAIYVSDLPRAVETAAPLARATGLTPTETPALRERSVGEMTGRTFEDVLANAPELWTALLSRDADWVPPGGESHAMCSARVGQFLDEVLAHHPSGRVVLVSHGVAIDHLLRRLLGLDQRSLSRFVFHVDNCSLHRVSRRDDGMFRVLALNETAHLIGIS